MEMERTRRSLDRARDLASLKKPRLSDDLSRDRAVVPPSRQRALPPRVASSASATSPPVDPRFRPSAQRHKDDREDPGRADAAPYQPRQPHQQQQQQLQELVGQYKTALAELTFNSKPIITNLTIIAGENLHAAKGIAAAICAHILEVPSEQKLPSLYLLDSVVKNIGRDYIKYFAARLPEVFCKVYKQVDSSIHPGMRHLFGTWKGVFPSAPLHFIEKELFSSVTNSSSSGTTTSETDSQTQCPSHSIHVNPKYLEARQRLQRSTRSAGASNDNTDGAVNSVEDFDRPGRASNTWSARPSTTDPLNSQSPLREVVKEPSRKKGSALGERDYDFTSDLCQYPELKMGRASKRVTERVGHDSSWYGTGRDELDTSIDQKNGLDVSPSHRSYKATGSSQIAGQQTLDKRIAPLKNNHVPSRSWRNSEEEEYMWDDVNSSLTDHAGKYSSMKAGWDPDDTERPVSLGRGTWMDTQCNKFGASQLEKISGGDGRVPTTKEFEESLAQSRYQFDAGLMAHMGASPDHLFGEGTLLGSRNPSGQLRQEPTNAFSHIDIVSRNSGLLEGHQIPLSSGLSTTLNSSFTKSGIIGHSGPSSGAVSSSLGTSISSNLLPCNTSLQHPKSYGLSGQDYHQHHSTPQTSQNPGHRLGQLNPVLSSKIGPDNFPISSQNHIQLSYTTASFQTLSQISQQNEAPSPSLAPFSEMQNHLPLVQPSQPDQLDRTEIPLQLSDDTWRPSVGVSAQLDSLPMGNNSFAESSGQPSAADLLAAIMKSGLISSKPSRNLHSSNVHLLPLPSGPPPVQAVIPSTSLVQPSTDSTSASSISNLSLEANPIRAVHPPLPPGPPPHSFLVSHVAGKADAKPNPLSNLLNVLIANGLISSTRADMLTEVAVEIKNEVEVSHQLPGETTPLSVSISDHSASTMDMSSTPSAGERPLSEPSESKGTNLSEVGAEILKDLIGFDFKPEVIRTFHPVVISALFDDLKHQCRICGLRFQLQDHLGKHLDLHDSNKSELCSQDQVFRKWFMNISDWIAGNILSESGSIDSTLIERTALSIEKNGPMVPADESQCICALCGDPFEDFYCHDTDTWMYKGTVYMMPSGGMGKVHNIDEDAAPGFIVHDQCFQGSSMDGL